MLLRIAAAVWIFSFTADAADPRYGVPVSFKKVTLNSHCYVNDSDLKLVIQDQKDFQKFLKVQDVSTKVCAPNVDFSKSTVLAFYSKGSCATREFIREVYRDDKAKVVRYIVKPDIVYGRSCLGAGRSDINSVAVPKIPSDYTIRFNPIN